jgi:membrane dipeptidase
MLHRRDFLIGAGAAALAAACAPKAGAPGAAAPAGPPGPLRPVQPTWPPYATAMPIDGASGIYLDFSPDMPAEEAAKWTTDQLAAVRACGLTAVVMTVAPGGQFWLNDAAFEKTKRDMAKWRELMVTHADLLLHVLTAADLERAHREKKLGIVFTFQGTEPLGEDEDRIPFFREQGVRVIQLTHNRRNLVGDGATEPGDAGLSKYGHQVIERLEAEKIVVDLAHGSARTIKEAIAVCKKPLFISHTGCRALADLTRNTHDESLRALAERGGVAGVIFWPYLRTDTQPMAIDVVEHLEHAINVAGEDHVGIGTDINVAPVERTPEFEKDNREMIADMVEQGIFEKGRPAELYTFIPDLNVANRFEKVAALLASRGHSDARIAKILGGNFARVMREVWGA